MPFQFDAGTYRYPSTRRVVFARKGMVCTSQPLAAQAGLDILKKGGNAVDAAIACAAAMTVLEPTSNGIGSDAFALVYSAGRLQGLNASGSSPLSIDVEKIRRQSGGAMPLRGWDTVTVPGAVGAWAALSSRYGKLPFEALFDAAISYAEGGYPLAPVTARLWKQSFEAFSATLAGEEYAPWFDTFAAGGRAPAAGETVVLPGHAETLREIATTAGKSFYTGALAEEIAAFSKKTGGLLSKEDLAGFEVEWVEPISAEYRGYTISEIPPNGHGIVALMALKILGGLEVGNAPSAKAYHLAIEALKLAYADGQKYVADPRHMRASVDGLLSDAYAASRRALIGPKAHSPEAGDPPQGGTVYLCTADGDGNMVSFIQSNYKGFGSGIVVKGTGIALQNRGANFSLDPSSDNFLSPGKRPYHTIIPGFLSKAGEAVGPFGVMGGFMQPQGHVQVVMNLADFGLNPQEALDAPRWRWDADKRVFIEEAFPKSAAGSLAAWGHEIEVSDDVSSFGRGQMILRDSEGTLAGATEPRADGCVAAW